MPGMYEEPCWMTPSFVWPKRTVHLKPNRFARMRAMAGQVSSPRYSWSEAMKTMCFPWPGPDSP